MTPQESIRKWKPVALTERSTAQEHFIDFEKGAPKTGGGEGWAEVWKKGFFAWEYKKKKRDLGKALEQLTHYAAALESPPLHVACDTHLFRIETRWTNEAAAKYEFELEELADSVNFARLRAVFHNPEELRSGRTRDKLTEEAADKFQTISDSLQHRNPDKEAVAHFVNQLVFCFFADGARRRPRCARPRRRLRLRLARGHCDRGRARPPARAEPRPREEAGARIMSDTHRDSAFKRRLVKIY
jgi:hypothetical protein